MAHTHQHSQKSGIALAFWLNLLFSVIEIIGGILTNSTAIIADAFHDFADALAIGLAVMLEKLSGKKRTARFSYGYKRFSLLSAVAMSVFLLVGALLMCIGAFKSFINPEVVNSKGMLYLAVLGIAINGFAFLRIKKSNEHSHAHGTESTQNSKAIMLHLLEDVLGWLAVLLGAAIIYFTQWYWIDGVLALGIAVFIGFNASKNLIGTMKIFLQSVPENVNLEKISSELDTIAGIENIHDLHVWSIDGNYNIASLHALVNTMDKNTESDILSSILLLLYKHNIHHPTIQIESSLNTCKLVAC